MNEISSDEGVNSHPNGNGGIRLTDGDMLQRSCVCVCM